MSDTTREKEKKHMGTDNNYYRHHFSFGPYRTDEYYYTELRVKSFTFFFDFYRAIPSRCIRIHEEKTL